jgi:DNA polymerase-3 subunit epsilon
MQRTLDDLGTPLFSTTFVVLDLETTGGSPTADAITEVGALKSRGGEITGTFHTLVSPGRPIPASIQLLTGISEGTVAGAPGIEAVLPSLWEFLNGVVLVAHNARFDASFLAAAFARHGYAVPFKRTVCTLRLARRLLAGETRNLKLETLARHFGAAAEPCHRAFPDARATLDVFHRLLELAGPVGVLTCEDLLVFLRTGRAPDIGKIAMTAHVPRVPGVYLFVDARGRILYVGKARNLRERVRSYFHGDDRRGIADLVREAAAVRVEPCQTELEAEILELRLIRRYQPPYNRRGRRIPKPAWVRIVPGRTARLAVTRTPKLAVDALLGPFPSQRAARGVIDAIQDAVPIARCSDPRRHPAGCAFGEMGRCIAPCLPGRAPEHDRLLSSLQEAVDAGGAELLDHLDHLMNTRAGMLRFEEAAEIRERALLLARALERRRAQRALAAAGDLLVCVPRPPDVEVAAIRSGRLVGSWRQPPGEPVRCEQAFETLTLADAAEADGAAADPPGDIDEVMLVWRFLTRAARKGGWVESCTGELASYIADRRVVERLAADRPALTG